VNPITKEEFQSKSEVHKYLKPRWDYVKVVLDYVKKMKFQSCLEIGPHIMPIFHDSDLLDQEQRIATRPLNFIWNCNKVPWPIEDKIYDVVIALQVWEHLSYPAKAFNEVKRISRNAILSVPYKWNKKRARASLDHCNITPERIKKWTRLNPEYSNIVRSKYDEERKGHRPRIVCCYSIGD